MDSLHKIVLNFNPFPVLESERLLFKKLENKDVAGVFALRSSEKSMKFIPRPILNSKEQALELMDLMNSRIDSNETINWAVFLKENPSLFVGYLGHYRIDIENYRSEIGYMILPEFEGKGYATEAVKAIVKYGFETINLHSIEAVIDPENFASERVLQRCGFVKEAHILENEYYNGKFWDSVIYSLLKRNFKD